MSESAWDIVSRQYGKALAQQNDAQLWEFMDRIPGRYWKPSTVYSGIAAKRRLYMKVKRNG